MPTLDLPTIVSDFAAGSVAAGLVGGGPGNWGSWADVSVTTTIANGIGGAMTGAFTGVIATNVGSGVGAVLLGEFVSGFADYFADVAGTALANGGTLPDPKPAPVGRVMPGWGCKPW